MIRPRYRYQGRALAVLGGVVMAWSSMVAPAAAVRAAPWAAPTAGPAASPVATPAATDGHEALRVRIDPGIEDAQRLSELMTERSAELLAGHEGWVQVEVGGETYVYRIEVTAMRDGKPLGPKREPVVCECTSEELLERIDVEVRRAVEELEQPVVEEPPPTPEGPVQPPEGEEPVQGKPPARWLLPTGAVLTAVGGAGLVSGVVMTAMGERPGRVEGFQIKQSRDWRNPTGYVVLGVGAGVLAAGVAMLVLHHKGCKRAPGSCGAKESTTGRAPGRGDWAVLPWIGGGELGMGVMGRFYGRRG